MHVLAYFYHWGRKELWDCPIKERHNWYEKVIEQLEEERKAINKDSGYDNPPSYTESY